MTQIFECINCGDRIITSNPNMYGSIEGSPCKKCNIGAYQWIDGTSSTELSLLPSFDNIDGELVAEFEKIIHEE